MALELQVETAKLELFGSESKAMSFVSGLWDKVLNVDGVDDALEMISIFQKQRTRVSKCSVGLKKYVTHLRSGARRRIEKWRSQLKRMMAAFKAHAQAVEYQDASTRRIAGFAAKHVMGDAQSLFSDLVMRGDVGLLDLIWLKKDRQTANINEALELQKSELERVERHFQGVVPK